MALWKERTLELSSEIELNGDIERIQYRNADSGFTVMKLRLDGERTGNVTVTGIFPTVEEGHYLRLIGRWTEHKIYGRQFQSMRALAPNTAGGITKYLVSRGISGIGEKTAKKIVDTFGLETLLILDNHPDRLREIPSIGHKKVAAIVASWETFKTTRVVEMFLIEHGLSPKLAMDIIRRYGDITLKVVTSAPYRLARDIRGIGFLTADNIAMKMGLPADAHERLEAAIIYLLDQQEESGHCYRTTEQIHMGLSELLRLPDSSTLAGRITDNLMRLAQIGVVVSENLADEKRTAVHYSAALYEAEQDTANMLATHLQAAPERLGFTVDDFLYQQGAMASDVPLSANQLEAVRRAGVHRVFILTGGPGVGKTTTANTIIKYLMAAGHSVALAAPTGRAAQRLAELSGRPAKTIHRLLEWSPEVLGFNRTEDNPIEATAVIIDESSMLDIRLFHALVCALPRDGKLILIGDTDQLPSVGPGNVLNDLICSQVIAYSRLTEIFRQAAQSNIIQAAHDINRGMEPHFNNWEAQSDCRFIDADSPEAMKATIKELVSDILPRKRGLNPLREIQVLTPMNRGSVGTAALNAELQAILNPPDQRHPEYKREGFVLRAGDKVIQCVNNYKLSVFNGDIGFVVATGLEGNKITVAFDGRQVTYDNSEITELSLAYAITIHKSQGSEFPVAIIPMTTQHFVMLQRNLVYTALTRARKLAIFVGSRKALAIAIKQVDSLERQTRLAERLNAAASTKR